MTKKTTKQYPNRQSPDPFISLLAKKHRVTPRQIRNIRDGKCSNDAVFDDYMTLKEWFSEGVSNLLFLKEITRIVPFQNPETH